MIRKYGNYYINWSLVDKVSVHNNQGEPFIDIYWPNREQLTLVTEDAKLALEDLESIIHFDRVHLTDLGAKA
jgi:hypothetical protein